MDKMKEFLIDHGEKLFFGVLALFCLYSISLSTVGLMSSGSDYAQIVQYETAIKSAKSREVKAEVKDYQEFVGSFQTKYTDFSDLDKVRTSLQKRVFTEETKVNPYEHVKDVIEGHTNSNSGPGVNCEKLFCKVRGENVCLVCGSKGEREYEFFAPLLSDPKLLPKSITNKYPTNPYVDRNEIKIIWEDHIQSDRTTYKKRIAGVYRFEVTDALEKSVGSHKGKPTYQQAIVSYIKEKAVSRLESISKDGYLHPVALGKPLAKGSESEKPKNAEKTTEMKFDMFGEKEQQEEVSEVSASELHKLLTEDVFYVMVDKSFKPLKKYWYVMMEEAHGESALKRPITAIRFSEPVEVTTGAENVFFLSRVKPKMDGPKPVEVNGKPVMTAEIQIFQYFKLQNIFYKYVFSRLEIGDPVGTMERGFKGEVKSDIMTSIKKAPREFLKGTDLNNDEWAAYSAAFPKAFENLLRTKLIKVDLNYDTGFVITDIGSETLKVQKLKGREPDGTDEQGRPKFKPKYEEEDETKSYVDIKNSLTGEVVRLYEENNSDISAKLTAQKIKTVDDLK